MRPTEVLRREHEVIERVLDAQDAIVRAVRRREAVTTSHLAALVEFLRDFADRFHHHKEERLLFPALERAGLPVEGGPIAVMLEEHRTGRRLIAQMTEAAANAAGGEVAALENFAEAAEAFGMLLRSHIQKENGVLFRIADRVLDEDTQEELSQAFEALAVARRIDGLVARARALADDVERGCPECSAPR